MGALKLLYDKIGTKIPQYLKRDGSGYEELRGANGAIDVNASVVGSLAKEPFSGSTTTTHTFTQPMNGFSITNDGSGDDLTFTIGDDTFIVKSNETWEYPISPFTVVTVTTAVPYRAWGLM